MRRRAVPLILLLLVLCGAPLRATYLIPYELRLHGERGMERYSLLVVLPDHFRLYFGGNDLLGNRLAQSWLDPNKEESRFYLDQAFSWYLELIANSPELYGENATEFAESLGAYQGIGDGHSSAVVLTEYRNFAKILGLLRCSVPNEAGLLPAEVEPVQKGLMLPLGVAVPGPGTYTEMAMVNAPAMPGFHSLLPPFSVTRAQGIVGGRAEVKNLGIPHRLMMKVFPYLFLTGRMHKMFSYAGPVPSSVTHWETGSRISSEERKFMGLRISELWMETSEGLESFYEKLLEAKTFGAVPREVTSGAKMNFMHVPMDTADAAALSFSERVLTRAGGPKKAWLIHDPGFLPAPDNRPCPSKLAVGTGKKQP